MVGCGTASAQSTSMLMRNVKGSFGLLSSTEHVPFDGILKGTRGPHILGRILDCVDRRSRCYVTD